MSRHRITGAALVAGIAGNPVAHSLSPVIHNAWLAAGDIDGVYAPFAPADAAGFEALVAAGRAGLILGLNVTAPFKEQAFALADQATPAARLTASANILTFDAGRVSADSSDGIGLMLGLKEQAPDLTLAGRPVVMLGAGGAARAGSGALIEAGAEVRIVNRSRDRAEALAADLGPSVRVMPASEALDGAVLVINALSIQPDLDFDAVAPGHGDDGHDLQAPGHALPDGGAGARPADGGRSGHADRSGGAVVRGPVPSSAPAAGSARPADGPSGRGDMILLGLTGSIGMGKSTTTAMFADLGAVVWNADDAVHRLYAPGGAAVEPVGAAFPRRGRGRGRGPHPPGRGPGPDETAFRRLEAIVHPLVAAGAGGGSGGGAGGG
jgi:shikimate dehydrogenase